MDGLIVLIILIPIAFFLLLIIILNRTGEQHRLLESLHDKIKQLSHDLSELSESIKEESKKEEEVDTRVKPVFKETPARITIIEKPAVAVPPAEPVIKPPVEQETVLPDNIIRNEEKTEKNLVKEEQAEDVLIKENQFAGGNERNNDLEKYIGENIANKIGIAVLVLGIAFFIKYAIDKNWINETGRVIIGLLTGSILIGLAHYFRNTYRSFSSVLVGGGLSVFYLSIAFAFHQYHLIGQTAAFVYMVIISSFAVVLSLYYNRQELAILATIGGFITPFLVSTGNENYVALFTYLCILNGGLIALSWFKRWPAINIISLFFTILIFGSWLIKRLVIEETTTFPYVNAWIFATMFYLLFMAMNIINGIRLKNKFSSFDLVILLSINFLYYLAGTVILDYWHNDDYKGLFTLLTGVFNLLLTGIFYRKKSVDRNFVSLLMGLSLTFISLTAPVQFRGNHIVLFWAAESVVLLWLYQRSKIRLLKIASLVITALMAGSLILNWIQVYFSGNEIIPVIFNKGFITTLTAAVSLFVQYIMLEKEKKAAYLQTVDTVSARNILLNTAISLYYLSGILEIYYQFHTRFPAAPVHVVYMQAYSFAFAIILLHILRKNARLPLLKMLFTIFSLGIYLISISANYSVSLSLLTTGINQGLYAAHWIAAILVCWLLCDLVRFFFKQADEVWLDYRPALTWIAGLGVILVFSIELYNIILWTHYPDKSNWAWWENLFYKAGLTILWSCCSFTLMWLGMKYSFRTLRIISLSLFTITLVKLFLYDIRNIPPGGKIVAFILLGVLLLVVSFMYQRLKKIIIDNPPG